MQAGKALYLIIPQELGFDLESGLLWRKKKKGAPLGGLTKVLSYGLDKSVGLAAPSRPQNEVYFRLDHEDMAASEMLASLL